MLVGCEGIRPGREQNIIAFLEAFKPTFGCGDIGQSIFRVPLSNTVDGVDIAPAVLPGSRMWVNRRHRWITGLESLMLQGFPP